MGLFRRLLGAEATEETQCPRCSTPSPKEARICEACGWNLREAFHGSYVDGRPTASQDGLTTNR